MRKLVLAMNTTLNGRLDDPSAWLVDLTDDLYTEIDRGYQTFDTVTYDEMVAYWPGAETEEGGSEINRRMARKMNTYKKFVFSREGEQSGLEWNNAELAIARSDQDLVRFVSDLKAQPGRDIHLSGGARLAQSMARLGLIDEYRFFVHPVVSPGASWFAQLEDGLGLELVSAAAYRDGVVAAYYRPRKT